MWWCEHTHSQPARHQALQYAMLCGVCFDQVVLYSNRPIELVGFDEACMQYIVSLSARALPDVHYATLSVDRYRTSWYSRLRLYESSLSTGDVATRHSWSVNRTEHTRRRRRSYTLTDHHRSLPMSTSSDMTRVFRRHTTHTGVTLWSTEKSSSQWMTQWWKHQLNVPLHLTTVSHSTPPISSLSWTVSPSAKNEFVLTGFLWRLVTVALSAHYKYSYLLTYLPQSVCLSSRHSRYPIFSIFHSHIQLTAIQLPCANVPSSSVCHRRRWRNVTTLRCKTRMKTSTLEI